MDDLGDLRLQFEDHASGLVFVNVSASDGQEHVILGFKVFVSEVNDAPTLTKDLPTVNVHEDSGPIRLLLLDYFADIDGDVLTFTATSVGPQNQAVNMSIQVSLNHTRAELMIGLSADEHGYAEVRVNADDNRGGTAEAMIHVHVSPVNDAPRQRNRIMHHIFNEKDFPKTVSYENALFDPDGDTLNYTLKDESGGMSPTVRSTYILASIVPNVQHISVEVLPYQTTGGTSHFAVCGFDPSNVFECTAFNVTIIFSTFVGTF